MLASDIDKFAELQSCRVVLNDLVEIHKESILYGVRLTKKEMEPVVTALKDLVHLHLCEQEGLSSGAPTPKQWLESVDKAVEALNKIGELNDI